MGTYITTTEIKAHWPADLLKKLTDDESAKTINDTNIELKIGWAENEIDEACQYLYNLPFNPVPVLIQRIALVLTVYYLFQRWGDDKRLASAYDWATKKLESIQSGVKIHGADSSQKESESYYLVEGLSWPQPDNAEDLDTRNELEQP